MAHLGRGHTDGDLVVVVAGADVVFAGDLIESAAAPSYGPDSFPHEWPGTLDGLLGGSLGDQVTLSCADDGDRVRATATATFNGWIALIPDWTFTVTATATKETAP